MARISLHDEPDYEPGSASYNVFYGNGQLHVSPHHDHEELMSHAGVMPEHTGPTAVGTVYVDHGSATWSVESNVGLRGLARVFEDYSKQVGWRWGGLTSSDGEPIDDEFAPKKSTLYYRVVEGEVKLGRKASFLGDVTPGSNPIGLIEIRGNTAFVKGNLHEGLAEWAEDNNFKLAEYPGGTDMNDRTENREDFGQFNNADPDAVKTPMEQDPLDSSTPSGTFRCPNCAQLFPNWSDYIGHRQQEDGPMTEEPFEDGKFPTIDLDKPLPAHHHDHQPTILPLASWKEAARVDGFDLYAGLWGYDNDTYKHYGAFIDGVPVGYATVKETFPRSAQVTMIQSAYPGHRIGSTLMSALQVIYDNLITGAASGGGEKLIRQSGWVPAKDGYFKWSAGQQPKDMIEAPLPFIYDIQKDHIALGHPGERTSDIPGEFTPGGIVEGEYNPGGKMIIRTMTNMPYSVLHLLELWYWSGSGVRHMEVTGVELQDASGSTTKLASDRLSTMEVGQYIKTLALADPAAWNAYQALRDAGGQVFVVGGAVRDALLQKQPKDIDLMVTGLPPEKIAHILDNQPGKVDLTGKDFGVYRYKTKGHEVEIALPRSERSTGDRRVDFDVSVDHNLPVESDLLRRDFTANAMAVNLDSGTLVDPYGGANDIESHKLRTVHPASFEEDPTRLVRALVASARHGLTPDEQTRREMADNAHRLDHESRERIQGELDKLFRSNNPAGAIRLARDTGMLKHLFPEVDENFDYDQNNPYHKLKLGEHLLNVLDNVSQKTDDPDLRVAALLHDIGKPASAWADPVTGFNHFYRGRDAGQDHETVGAQMAERRLHELKWFPTSRIQRIKHIIDNHMFPEFSSDKGARRFLHNVGDQHADDLIKLRWADQYGKGSTPEELASGQKTGQMQGLVEQVRSKQEPTQQSALSVNGNDIIQLGVPAGPEVGKILRLLTDDVVDDPMLNDRAALLERAQEYVNARPA